MTFLKVIAYSYNLTWHNFYYYLFIQPVDSEDLRYDSSRMNRLHTHISINLYNFRSIKLLKSNMIRAAFASHTTTSTYEPPQHEFLTAERIISNSILVPIMRTIYSTHMVDLKSLILQFSRDFKRKHSKLVLFWSSFNHNDLVSSKLPYLTSDNIRDLENYTRHRQQLRFADFFIFC